MSLVLRVYDDAGTEIGWMKAVETESIGAWDTGWEYPWELTHPKPEEWVDVRRLLSNYSDPRRTGGGIIETDPDDPFDNFRVSRAERLDEDGPEAYLQEVGRLAKNDGAARTELKQE